LNSDPLQLTNVIEAHPEIAARMRKHLYAWWDEVGPLANEVQRVVIGSDHENPARLTACEWLDVFIDQQNQIRRGEQKSGYWMLEVAEPGIYEFEMRRWPKEIDRPLSAPGENGRGGLSINFANLYLSDHHHTAEVSRTRTYGSESYQKKVNPEDTAVTFTATLEKGPVALHTWFRGEDTILSAYYVYVTRK
jgi:hypothetical protein